VPDLVAVPIGRHQRLLVDVLLRRGVVGFRRRMKRVMSVMRMKGKITVKKIWTRKRRMIMMRLPGGEEGGEVAADER